MSKKNTRLAQLALLATALIWGSGFIGSQMALDAHFSSAFIILCRFGLSALVFGVVNLGTLRRHLTLGHWKAGFAIGTILFLAFYTQTVGLAYTTPSKNAFLTATNVVFVPFIALVIYHKKIDTRSLIGAGMAIVGAGVLSLQNDFSIGIGDGLTLLCAVGFAFQIFLTGEFVGKIRPSVLNFLQMTTACLLSAVGLLLSGEFTFQFSMRSLLAVGYLGVVSTTVCYLLQTVSQKYVDETKSAIILSMEAVFGTIFSVILLHEAVTVRMVVGSALILSAVLVSEIQPKKQKEH